MNDAELRSDSDLLEVAREVLLKQGFACETVGGQSADALLAENRYFVIGLACTSTIDGLVAAEPLLEQLIRTRIEDVDLGPKVWDAYVVLLTREKPLDNSSAILPLFQINYDTNSFRRIARAGVEPTLEGVRDALVPFVKLIELEGVGIGGNPLQALAESMAAHGADPSVASMLVQVFRDGGRVDDAV